MNNLKPKVKINKFTEAGKGLLFYNEGLIADNENGNSLLYDGYRTLKIFDNSDTAFTTLTSDNVMSLQFLKTKKDSNNYRLIVTDGGKFISSTFSSTSIKDAIGLTLSTSGNYSYSQFPDLLELPSGNLLYSSTNNLGLVIRGYCKTGSGTTKIIDTQGRNFTTLGLSTTGLNNKIWNLKTGTLHTITSITTTTATNDTLNFDAGTDNLENDEFIAVVWDKFDLKADISPAPVYSVNDKRQIKATADYFFVLNNNFLARVEGDEATFNSDEKQLPVGHKGESFEINTGKFLVSTSKENGEMFLCLWDGASDGWNNIMKVDYKISCIKAYKSGFIFVMNGTLYYTDGFTLQEMSTYNDTTRIDQDIYSLMVGNFNSIVTLKDTIFIVSSYDNLNRTKLGVMSFNEKQGWSFIPVVFKGRLYGTPKSIFFSDTGLKQIEVGLTGGISSILEGSNSSVYLNKSCIYLINLDREEQIFGIGLNLGVNFNKYINANSAEKKTNITVAIGDGSNGIVYSFAGNITGTGEIQTPNTYDLIDIGDEIVIFDADSTLRGERTFVTNKTNGATTINLQISPVFSGADNNSRNFKILKLRKCDTKEIILTNLNREQIFYNPIPFLSNKLFVEITINGIASSFPVSLMGINIY